MKLTKEQLENLINGSPVFTMNKESEAYANELCSNFYPMLIEYCNMLYSKYQYENFSGTILETAKYCLKSYKNGSGNFLNYFNKSFVRKVKTEKCKAKNKDFRHGIVVSDKVDRLIIRIKKLESQRTWDGEFDTWDGEFNYKSPQELEEIAHLLGESIDDVEEAARAMIETSSIESVWVDDDGEETDIFDITGSKEIDALGALVQDDELIETINKIERGFAKQKNMSKTRKKVFGMVISSLLFEVYGDKIETAEKDGYGAQFLDGWVVDYFRRSGDVAPDKEMAKECGVSPESFSRTKKDAKKFLGEILLNG